jgi:hypothetical protein
MSDQKAFRIDWGHSDKVIVSALSHSKAKSFVVNQLLDADYAYCYLDGLYCIKSCKRAHEFDRWAETCINSIARNEKELQGTF